MFWKYSERLKIILQIIYYLIAIGSIIGGTIVVIANGLSANVPAWTLILVAIISILFGISIRKLIKVSKTNKLLGQIRFNYESGNPTIHDWTIKGQREPIFETILDGEFGRVLKINPNSSYSMDYSITPDLTSANTVDAIIKAGSEWFICCQVLVISKDNPIGKNVWLSYRFGSKNVSEFYSDSMVEWKIELPKVKLENNWSILSMDFINSLKHSFGKEGWQFQKLITIRFRGDFTIAKLDFY